MVEDQAAKLMFSGLYHAVSAIFCGVGAPSQGGAMLAAALLQSYGTKFQVLPSTRYSAVCAVAEFLLVRAVAQETGFKCSR